MDRIFIGAGAIISGAAVLLIAIFKGYGDGLPHDPTGAAAAIERPLFAENT